MEIENKHILPQFPLSIVAFPGEKVNLHIFEPRYRQLINECYNNNTSFGIAPFVNGELIFYGTEMKVLEISQIYDDGKMDVKTKGQRIYHIHQFEKKLADKLYPAATVSYLKEEKFDDTSSQKVQILDAMSKLFEMLKVEKPISDFTNEFSSYKVAHHIGLSIDDKINLLRIQSEPKRLDLIIQHLNKFLPEVGKAEEVKTRAALNGHFKNLKSPDF